MSDWFLDRTAEEICEGRSPLTRPIITTPEIRERFIAFMETQGYPREFWTLPEDAA